MIYYGDSTFYARSATWYMMSQHTADDHEPIYTTTRVPPAESAGRMDGPTGKTSAAPDDRPIQIARVMPAASRSG